MWLDLSDEDSCNWMMFVRPAQNHLEQNLVAYQYGSEIFYTTIKNIQPKQELKVSPVFFSLYVVPLWTPPSPPYPAAAAAVFNIKCR